MSKQFQGNRSGYSRNGNATGRKLPPSETFSRINPDTKFIENEDIEGIHLIMDFDLVRELQVRLGRFISNGTSDFFAAMWPVSLSTDNVHSLARSSYVVAPKPTGPRFFLYIDPSGDIFLENMTQHIFRVDEDHAINIQSFDGRPITDTVLDGIFTREKSNGDSSCDDNLKEEGAGNPRKLTFVIQDAIRCNGKDLTQSNIVQRIAYVRGEIMKPRLYAVNNRKGCNDKEAFDLDIADYQEAYQTENYLSRDFTERFKYPYRSLVFFPRKKGYTSGTNYEAFQWQENDIQECSFRLKIRKGVQDPKEAELHVGGPHRSEIKYGTITLTEELKKLDGCIIDCNYFDHQWIFIKQRLDRNHPNGRRSVQGKLTALENAVSRERLMTNLEKSKGLD